MLRCFNGKAFRCSKAQTITLTRHPDSAGPWWSAANFWLARYSTAESQLTSPKRPRDLPGRLFLSLGSLCGHGLSLGHTQLCLWNGSEIIESVAVVTLVALTQRWRMLYICTPSCLDTRDSREAERRADERHYDSAFLACRLLPSNFAGMVSSWAFEHSVLFVCAVFPSLNK